MRARTIRLFWKKVDKNGPVPMHRPELGRCWIWTAYRLPKGYGRFAVEGAKKVRQAHVVSYEIAFGSLPVQERKRTGRRTHWLLVLHHCDNPPCVNPSHLFLGTHRANNEDRDRKGRSVHHAPRGIDAPGAKLTEADVLSIRARCARSDKMSAVAGDYAVSEDTIRGIYKRLTWTHLPSDPTLPTRDPKLAGELNPKAKLTADLVREIRARSDRGERANAMAPEYGVSPNILRMVILRRSWKHVP